MHEKRLIPPGRFPRPMDAPEHALEPVLCPLCGARVRDRPDPEAIDIRMLERHLATDCPAAVNADSGPGR